VTLVDVRTLEVRGDITFGMPGVQAIGHGTVMIPTSLTEQISELQSQINQLAAKVAALEAKQ
jgi:hypothetical protein